MNCLECVFRRDEGLDYFLCAGLEGQDAVMDEIDIEFEILPKCPLPGIFKEWKEKETEEDK